VAAFVSGDLLLGDARARREIALREPARRRAWTRRLALTTLSRYHHGEPMTSDVLSLASYPDRLEGGSHTQLPSHRQRATQLAR
jgi:hypothetical protein